MKLKVGIFFGGPSREREISFAGGRTVYDNLDKSIFEPVLLFVDSHNTIIQLDWEYVYKGTIRDFYPPIDLIPTEEQAYQLYIEHLDLSDAKYDQAISAVGQRVSIDALPTMIDIAFLALHGRTGEDGTIQGLLEYLQIPYTGSDVMASAIGMDKGFQKEWMQQSDFTSVNALEIKPNDRLNIDDIASSIGIPCVVRPSHQGSSIGVSIINDKRDLAAAIDKAFFKHTIDIDAWKRMSTEDKQAEVRAITDIRSGIGLPIIVDKIIIKSPHQLEAYLNTCAESSTLLQGVDCDSGVIVESFIHGMEFSCVVTVDEEGEAFALPPTQIVKGDEMYDYQSKYMPGRSRKITPINLTDEQIIAIQDECIRLFRALKFRVYARIDGFFTDDGRIILNDPNTTSGMLPSSFFFHQAAELGLNPSQFITYIIRNSIAERQRYGLQHNKYQGLIAQVDSNIRAKQSQSTDKTRVGVILGGYSFERHISVESGRNIFEKLSSSATYEAIPLFLTKSDNALGFDLYQIPINILLKDNADDIAEAIRGYAVHPVTQALRDNNRDILTKYGSSTAKPVLQTEHIQDIVDVAFIALHGRPGEDGKVQEYLGSRGIPFNGSESHSAAITIDKYTTLQTLKANGFEVTDQLLLQKSEYQTDDWVSNIEAKFEYPFIAKPVDDGCSSAVVKIRNREQLETYLAVLFRDSDDLTTKQRQDLDLVINEEFPRKEVVLIEALIDAKDAKLFMEITGGMLFHNEDGEVSVEVFEPSEVLATGEVLSLEEKFLAGEGQNITPARFGQGTFDYSRIATHVKNDLANAAKTLDVSGYCRIDAFVRVYDNDRVETIVIEVNSLPGMTPATCIFHQCAINQYKPYDFIDKILKFGVRRSNSQPNHLNTLAN